MADRHTNDLDALKSHQDVIRLYQNYVPLRKENGGFATKCPFHADDTPSLKLKLKDGCWLWFCHGACHEGGTIIDFVKKIENTDVKSAIKRIKSFIDGSWSQVKSDVDKVFHSVNEETDKKSYSLDQYAKLELALDRSKEAKEFLESRGISFETAKKCHLGFKQGISSGSEVCKNGGWLVFPCVKGDQVVSIKYRSILAKEFSRQPGMTTSLFNTESIDFLEPIFVTEGELDALVLEQAGYHAVSLPSAIKTLTPEMRDELKQAESIILAGDTDSVGDEAMRKLWAELGERTFMLKWPAGMKDANQTFLEHCEKDAVRFRTLVDELTQAAKSQPIPNFYDLSQLLGTSTRTDLANHPNRFRFPWKSVDEMAVLLPGSVIAVSSTNTKQGKSVWVINATIEAARKDHEVVVNYQCELSGEEFANIVASYLTKQDRNYLTAEGYQKAKQLMQGVSYYFGRDETLSQIMPVLDLIEKAIKRFGATVVVLDHVHFLCRNEQDEIKVQANASQRIKRMAQQYGVKFIVVMQPRKAKQDSRGKNIHITDMKGSEAFTSDADAIFALHRNWLQAKDPDNPPRDDYDPITEVNLLGARAKGPGATLAKLMYEGETATFREISYAETPAGIL
jgi:DNA primase